MLDFKIHNNSIQSVFELIGSKEDDISKSVAWAFANCPHLFFFFLKKILKERCEFSFEDLKKIVLRLQKHESKKGFTDFEISLPGKFFLTIEAKRGWILPSESQLYKYSERKEMKSNDYPIKKIVTLSECSKEYAETHFPKKKINNIEVTHQSWKDIFLLAEEVRPKASNASKRILNDLRTYLQKLMSMQNKNSNWVYVVSLSHKKMDNWNSSFVEIVQNLQRYFHPIGHKGFPKEPPNYIAFRFNGKLQSIHHIESYDVFSNPSTKIDEAPNEEWGMNHFIYSLGEPIYPPHEIKNGKIYPNGRYWCMLDTLLTSQTVAEARDISKLRLEQT